MSFVKIDWDSELEDTPFGGDTGVDADFGMVDSEMEGEIMDELAGEFEVVLEEV
jgi:hypothetical protein